MMERNVTSVEHYTPILIVGTGISGLAVAYYLSKNNIKYTITTKRMRPNRATPFLQPQIHVFHQRMILIILLILRLINVEQIDRLLKRYIETPT